ncbi:papain inhibitor-like isoform X2 [Paramacrobiotus metropolitanus]|uniref:papain inhibitor-like isoform X2 n=1 Tax=Paramacrobiotus metropolitanus TaxID=2943436 RepID=UPI002445E5B0|nr:papain inhibitor-like isoform X2 [Paramacrobiotus metropolitanus]
MASYYGVFVALAAVIVSAQANIPWGKTFTGTKLTFYNDAGYGACGTQINAASQDLVAISHEWYTSANPNVDPFCTNDVCVRVTYNGKSITAPVKDKCPSCSKAHLDLSKTAFQQFADTSVGVLQGATYSFVKC